MSNLNPGIAMTIWNVVPFLLALADRVLWKVTLMSHNIIGMILMVVCGCAISLSNLLEVETVVTTEVPVSEKEATLGTWVPVLVGVACALCLVFCIVGMKYATVYLHVDPHDFSYGMYGIQGLILQLLAIIHFNTHGDFVMQLWV
jgi:drug/metabolite transporter (DMT)-like permease